jgi:hypothetical protein
VNTSTYNWRNQIAKRRDEGGDVAHYVKERMRDIPVKDIVAFLTDDELQKVLPWKVEERRAFAAFWQANPPAPLTAPPEIKTEGELFDVLKRYHIKDLDYSFGGYVCYGPEGKYQDGEPSIIEARLLSDLSIDLETELPGDEDGSIGRAICSAIAQFGDARAMFVACDGSQIWKEKRFDGKRRGANGNVFFDIVDRHFSLSVTLEESFQRTWAPDETDDMKTS